ncbi:MICAL-like protein 1-like [Homarus americanus]|uniref:MICAL-like protein 1-like n=1 Tax=Homarus americanus TaxID=6706 RepID=A0A8J5N2X4_HOMAM|nr:MICAL-like protein 1-like [Homarus americanus]
MYTFSNPSQMYPGSPDKIQLSPASLGGSATRKKIIAPPLSTSIRELFPPTSPPAQPHPSPSLSPPTLHPSPSSPSGSLALKRKGRRAPAPPQVATPKSGRASPTDSTADTLSMDTMSLSSIGTQSQEKQVQEEDQDEVLSWKMQKDMKNHSNKMNGTTDQRVPPPKPSRAFQASQNLTPVTGILRRPSMSKSEAGEWQRKKGPAPPRPVPQKRALKKLPMRIIQQELQDIEIKQTELERQGVLLETSIRSRTENTPNNSVEDATTPSSGPNSIEVEDMILQLFELVNEKNELFRRQTELMYLKREKRLEEEYVELEYQIRCLMLKPPSEKTETDTTQEEELIARLVKVVEQRDEIINCLELDRLREAQEDESIATHMMQYQEKHIDGIENGSSLQVSPKKKKTLKLPKKKKKKEKKDKKDTKADADKDIDETETTEVKKKKKKKKWLF